MRWLPAGWPGGRAALISSRQGCDTSTGLAQFESTHRAAGARHHPARYNTGAAFSFLAEASGWQRWLFVWLARGGERRRLLVWLRRLTARRSGCCACGAGADRSAGRSATSSTACASGASSISSTVHWDRALLPGVQRGRFGHHRRRGAAAAGCLAASRRGHARRRRPDAGAARQPTRLLRRRRPRHRHRRAGASSCSARPIYVRHEVVHNRHVVERLRELGAVFVEELDEVPAGATVIFSAHGVSHAGRGGGRASARLTVFDATCPLVTKVHMEVQRYAREGRDVILIGHAGHPEVEGTMGRFDTSCGGRMLPGRRTSRTSAALQVRDPARLAFVTQTTLSVDDTAEIVAALRARFPAARDAATRGHLLRHAEPPGCGQEAARACDRAGGRGLAVELQLQPPARAGRPGRHSRLPGRRAGGPARASGSTGRKPSASPPAPRLPRSWCSESSSSCASGAARSPRSSRAARST